MVTDLDNTLVGDDGALQRFNGWFKQHRQTYGSKLVYATGRSLKSYQRLTTQIALLEADILIASVGSEIYYPGYKLDEAWSSLSSLDWNRAGIVAITQQFPQLILQSESEQRPFKLSFVLHKEDAFILPELQAQLIIQGIEAELIYSNDHDLDIMRRKVNKGSALTYICRAPRFAAKQIVVCGDSGNDIALFAVNKLGIIVGNARTELLQWHQDNLEDDRYLAQANYAGGIIEGLKHFGIMHE
ncbi:sucrose-phosphate phosphatase [Leptolyngbya sp. FACHB-36]|uniref:sucrose-phosphate phosphatase n=1 Tax=Leptolyngbya sp. FACHB-36 TaxID=2692808 RepID=UPI001F54DAFE|nr:sucrose-phosphate phosphatase [Leptolyngbya sp. FACHB-36]